MARIKDIVVGDACAGLRHQLDISNPVNNWYSAKFGTMRNELKYARGIESEEEEGVMLTRAEPPDWAGLPEHLLDIVTDKLDLLSDYVRFSAVCHSWLSVAIHNQRKEHRWQNKTYNTNPPLLLIPTKDGSKTHRSLYNFIDKKIYDFQLKIPFHRRCAGSSHGWLVFFDRMASPVLINPFLQNDDKYKPIRLPSFNIRYFGDCTIPKVVLSANPALVKDYVVGAIYSHYHLAFMKVGDESWTDVPKVSSTAYQDLIFYNDKLVAVNERRGIVSVDVFSSSSSNRVTIIAPNNKDAGLYGQWYLVETLAGELLRVEKILGYDYPEIIERFDVYKLVLDKQTGMVVKSILMKSIGSESLFLGYNYSMSLMASKYPGVKGNCIYYTDDYVYAKRKMQDSGIYCLEDGKTELHYVANPSHIRRMPCPIWIMPTLQHIPIRKT